MTENHEVGILTEDSEVIERVESYLTFLQTTLHNPILSRSDERFSQGKKPLRKLVTKILRRKKTERKKTDFETCPKCGKELVKREGKTGKLWGCTGYPECRYTRNIEWKKTDFKTCPKCGKKLVKREGKTGKLWGCTGYPECPYTENIEWKKTKSS